MLDAFIINEIKKEEGLATEDRPRIEIPVYIPPAIISSILPPTTEKIKEMVITFEMGTYAYAMSFFR